MSLCLSDVTGESGRAGGGSGGGEGRADEEENGNGRGKDEGKDGKIRFLTSLEILKDASDVVEGRDCLFSFVFRENFDS